MRRQRRVALAVVGAGIALTAVVLAGVLWFFAGAGEPRGASGRADKAEYQRLRRDPVVALRPPGAAEVEVVGNPPCGGDSSSGLSVVVSGSAPGRDEEVFEFYRQNLARLGWGELDREHVRSAGGDFDQLTAATTRDGYRLYAGVRNVRYGMQTFDVVLSAEPRYVCPGY